jgi:hypothetical protein
MADGMPAGTKTGATVQFKTDEKLKSSAGEATRSVSRRSTTPRGLRARKGRERTNRRGAPEQ